SGETGFNSIGQPEPLDSLFVMEWMPAPGAVGYYIQVYQPSFNLTSNFEQMESGVPAPIYAFKSRDILVAYIPAPSNPAARVSFRMPTPGARSKADTTLMTVRQTNFGQTSRVSIAPVDARADL